MTFKSYATVLIDKNINKPLDYGVPDSFIKQLSIGSRVLVPVKKAFVPATVLHIRNKTAIEKVLPIKEIILDENILTDDLFKLGQWMSNYYATSLRKVVSGMLPTSVKKNIKEKKQLFIIPLLQKDSLTEYTADIRNKKPAQARVLDVILENMKGLLLTDLIEKSKSSASAVHALIHNKILDTKLIHIDRLNIMKHEFFKTAPKKLNDEQQIALNLINHSIEKEKFQTFLLHGVTGSGKTEVYLQAIQKTIDLGKDVIFLVPEIALTSQTIERLKARFQSKIAILHHRLSDGERFDSWHMMRKGEIKIVVGARSAIFAPFSNIGLIIVDEEQESSYKQTEEMPTYHARDIAVVRASKINATVILGSATPSMESFSNAKSGKYQLLTLNKRAANAPLPDVELVDMNLEKEKKNFSLFSDRLLTEMKKRYEKGEQTILFLNRRGYYSVLKCQSCNEVLKCPHCDVSLTFHKGENCVSCHMCGYNVSPPPTKCKCGSQETIKFSSPGTELIERSIKAIFPFIKTIRMDADTTRHKGSHDQLFRMFKSGKADVLIGTQMIAKGLHFPSVTLVGVLNADHALQLPDFRATEMVFQLLTQVSGRSGRGPIPGKVIIQSHLLDHPIMQFASKEDYLRFFEEEMKTREMFSYPPFKRITKIVFTSEDPLLIKKISKNFHDLLVKHLPKEYVLTSPIPCGYVKIKNKYRYQFLIKGSNQLYLSKELEQLHAQFSSSKIKILIDVDPIYTFS